ncbi:dipeptide ABC transporter ATP-binding protein [Microbacterium sp.]|uniref:ABC transporter ATP-binding protein n=1 Tax=Microbacterium sp. TaxID=51671 RepID=UPI003341FD8B
MTATTPLLEVEDLRVHFSAGSRFAGGKSRVKAVDGVSFALDRGETLGLVGESGCGKSTTGRAVLQLTRPTGGSVRLDGVELTALGAREVRRTRRRMQMVFQDPYSSLDPRMTVADALAEPLRIHRLASGPAVAAKVKELLDSVGLPASAAERYPHEFSGGQRQRIAIARALAVDPDLLICDEPISALDVSVQAQVLNLFDDLQERYGLAYLFIAHDLAAVRHVSHRIAVMYLGGIVEAGERDEIVADPLHPYTRALISAVPRIRAEERGRERIVLGGDLPSPANPPSGCRFSTRCPFAQELCRTSRPELQEAAPGRTVACHFWAEIRAGEAPATGGVAEGGAS